MVGLGVGGVACNLRDMKKLLFRGERTSKVLSLLTKNVARALELTGKGEIKKGASADLCFFDADWELQSVMSRGVVMMRDKEILVKGTFEL
jgi:beta-aspartyl-dipeptidase (metallo-type)